MLAIPGNLGRLFMLDYT